MCKLVDCVGCVGENEALWQGLQELIVWLLVGGKEGEDA